MQKGRCHVSATHHWMCLHGALLCSGTQNTRSPFRKKIYFKRQNQTYDFRESPESELEQDKYTSWPHNEDENMSTYHNNRKDSREKIQRTQAKTNNRWSVKMVGKELNRTVTNNKLPCSLEGHGQGLTRLPLEPSSRRQENKEAFGLMRVH